MDAKNGWQYDVQAYRIGLTSAGFMGLFLEIIPNYIKIIYYFTG